MAFRLAGLRLLLNARASISRFPTRSTMVNTGAMFAGISSICSFSSTSVSNSPIQEENKPAKLKIALLQILTGEDKQVNLEEARNAILTAAQNGAKMVVLPECWNSPYNTSSFPKYAEKIPQNQDECNPGITPSTYMLSQLAKELKIYIVGGSIPESDSSNRIYNSCVVINPNGDIIAKHRKVHLFDINIPGKITFIESETLTAGDSITTFNTEFGKFGIGICYDLRFPELSLVMREQGCDILLFPGAFNMTTGPVHWELLQRARAVDNQVFVAAVCGARNPQAGYQAWGHSTVVDPWGEIVATTGHERDIVYADLDLLKIASVRQSVPVSKQRRPDLYRPYATL